MKSFTLKYFFVNLLFFIVLLLSNIYCNAIFEFSDFYVNQSLSGQTISSVIIVKRLFQTSVSVCLINETYLLISLIVVKKVYYSTRR
jgi:hypothetical protein